MPQYAFDKLQSEYAALWSRMTVTKTSAAAAQARRIIANKARYKTVEQTTSVPWFVVGCMHMRESDGNFETWLHNGDPMKRHGQPARTVQVPKGRPPNPDCSWEDGSKDALVEVEHLDSIDSWDPAHVAYALETFNGFGYRSPARNIPSPYLWGGTNIQKPGKFVRDGVYDRTAIDPQIGGMAVLQMIMSMDAEAKFIPPAVPVVVLDDETETLSAKAIDTEENVKPLTRSKTMWGGIGGYLTSAGGMIVGFFDKLSNPYTLAAFIAVLGALSVFAYLVIKGRIDVQGIVKHLSDEE